MRVLIILVPAFNPNDGGVQRTSYKIGKFFSDNGIDVAYYSLATHGHINVEFGELFHSLNSGEIENTKNQLNLIEVLSNWKPDIVINQMPYESKLSSLLSSKREELDYKLLGCLRNSLFSFKSNIKDILSQRYSKVTFKLLDNPIGINLMQFTHRLKHRTMLKKILDEHDKYILLAPPNLDELKFFVGNYKLDKVLSIPNSIPAVFDNRLEKEKIILHVGRLNIEQKRSDLLLEFWEKAYPSLPEWKFIIIGDGPHYEQLQKDVINMKLPRVTLLGHRKPEPYWKKASIFVMPSAYEGFPNTILEAQSYGVVPVVFNSYSALNWIVNDGKDAILVNPFDTKGLAMSVVDLAMDNQKRYKLAEKTLVNARRFTIDEVGKRWVELFKSL